jgi:hypothetical protein
MLKWLKATSLILQSRRSICLHQLDLQTIPPIMVQQIKLQTTPETRFYANQYNKINVREYRRGNQKWAIQRNWQHRIHKTQKRQTKNTTQYATDTTIHTQAQITSIKHEFPYKQLEVKTKRTSFSFGNGNGHHNTKLNVKTHNRTTQKTKGEQHVTHQKIGDELMWSRRLSSHCLLGPRQIK